MVFDQAKDSRRLRITLLCSSGLLGLVLIGVAYRGCHPSWRGLQEQYVSLGLASKEFKLEVRQLSNCSQEQDRCTSCHLGIRHPETKFEKLPQPFRTHPLQWAHHLAAGIGCTDCHGGTGRALSTQRAHAMPGTDIPDPLLTQPHIQASCARCHVAGTHPGMERLTAGAKLYLELGCMVCHPLSPDGLGGWEDGTDLRRLSRKELVYFERSLIEPTANFSQSTMPSFKPTFAANPRALQDLLIYLQSLSLEPVVPDCNHHLRSAVFLQNRCTHCHTGNLQRSGSRFKHVCSYILDRADNMQCSGCHPSQVPENGPGDGWCPVIQQHRQACSVCHHIATIGKGMGP